MEDGNIANKVVIDDHITVIDGDNTTAITGDTVSTTTLSGTLDAESMKNSLTAEAVQNVVPIDWGAHYTRFGEGSFAHSQGGTAIGRGSKALHGSVAVGGMAYTELLSTAIGYNVKSGSSTIAIGYDIEAWGKTTINNNIILGMGLRFKNGSKLMTHIGSGFTETTDSGNVTHTCTTEGTGSITIGAGANTLNTTSSDGTVKESSNSITIGCKANNSGADSVVIGASVNNTTPGNVLIGAGARLGHESYVNVVAIGKGAAVSSYGVAVGTTAGAAPMGTSVGYAAHTAPFSVAVGRSAETGGQHGTAVGFGAKAKGIWSTAIGSGATVNDEGATAIRSSVDDDTYTQLYFSGANTPLAKKYFPTAWEKKQDVDEHGNPKVDENGEPVMVDDKDKPIAGEAMMGFVAKDKNGNIIARGANMLSALFPYYNGDNENPFAPATMSLDGEAKEPIAFHPSDLDMPIEEAPIEEEYKPLPVYPIVEPTIDEITE